MKYRRSLGVWRPGCNGLSGCFRVDVKELNRVYGRTNHAASSARAEPYDQTAELNFLPPAELSKSVWQSLADNIRSRMHPEKLPPLQLTSKPIEDDGLMLPDDFALAVAHARVSGTCSSPEKLPPLQLTSKPIEDNDILPRHRCGALACSAPCATT